MVLLPGGAGQPAYGEGETDAPLGTLSLYAQKDGALAQSSHQPMLTTLGAPGADAVHDALGILLEGR